MATHKKANRLFTYIEYVNAVWNCGTLIKILSKIHSNYSRKYSEHFNQRYRAKIDSKTRPIGQISRIGIITFDGLFNKPIFYWQEPDIILIFCRFLASNTVHFSSSFFLFVFFFHCTVTFAAIQEKPLAFLKATKKVQPLKRHIHRYLYIYMWRRHRGSTLRIKRN